MSDKKILEESCAFRLTDAPYYFRHRSDMRIPGNVPYGTARSKFGIPRTEDDTAHVGLQRSTGAHGAGFQCDHQCAVGQIPCPSHSNVGSGGRTITGLCSTGASGAAPTHASGILAAWTVPPSGGITESLQFSLCEWITIGLTSITTDSDDFPTVVQDHGTDGHVTFRSSGRCQTERLNHGFVKLTTLNRHASSLKWTPHLIQPASDTTARPCESWPLELRKRQHRENRRPSIHQSMRLPTALHLRHMHEISDIYN
jgi:hypothetical protein